MLFVNFPYAIYLVEHLPHIILSLTPLSFYIRSYSKGVASPERFVRTRLYFTSESHLHSILTILQHGGLADALTDEQWKRAMDYVSTVPELNYLSQVVIMIYEDPTVVSTLSLLITALIQLEPWPSSSRSMVNGIEVGAVCCYECR